MIDAELLVVGGGPAGLSASALAAEAGVKVLLCDRSPRLGGQLVKQTHKFFGSEKQHAKTRGFRIASELEAALAVPGNPVETRTETTVLGLYPDRVATLFRNGRYDKVRYRACILCPGAGERFLAFENNDLPGIYGAGAVQTLMNVHGVLPGKEVVMVGSGNIGLIVAYQLVQAGVKVRAVLEASPKIGGYKVHAAKLARLGIPIRTQTTVLRAQGTDRVERVVLSALDSAWNPVPGTEETLECDCVCVAVGLTPLFQLGAMAGAEMKYVPELGGTVPLLDAFRETTVPGLFCAGDASGIEEASAAIVGGKLAGLSAARFLEKPLPGDALLREDLLSQLKILRSGPFGAKIRAGAAKAEVERHA